MRARIMALIPALAIALGPGCAADGGPRDAGDAVTEDEAALLGGLLHRNLEEGGADFVVTAPYGPGAVLTLTGEVDFRSGTGRARAVTGTDDGEVVRSIFFTRDELWFGDVPGLADVEQTYLRRAMASADEQERPLVDVLVTVVLGLAADAGDDPAAFLDGGYTWEGRRSIDGRPTAVFGLPGDRTVAVSSVDDVLVQFTTPLPVRPGADPLEATTTLGEHGPRTLQLPDEAQTGLAAEHPELEAAIGL
jgi:hypothetical protein